MRNLYKALLACFVAGLSAVQAQDTTSFKPSIQAGGFLQVQGVFNQARPQGPGQADDRWERQVQVWRARLMAGSQLTRRTGFFMQTEIATPLGFGTSTTNKVVQSPNIVILDAQIEHAIAPNHFAYIGQQLTGINRQGLQSPVTLLGQEFGWYQYPYNLFPNQPLQNNFGRDIGASVRGYVLDERLEYRAGVFRGRIVDEYSPLRTSFRLNYNFFDLEKGHYYTGTNLGEKKLLSLGAGAEFQADYYAYAVDLFADLPSASGAFTGQFSFMHLNSGTENHRYSFGKLIPQQNILFTELGYYFKKAKIQPYVKWEAQLVNAKDEQVTTAALGIPFTSKANFNTFNSASRIGVGIGRYVEAFNFHIKLQYEQVNYGRFSNALGETETRSGGEFRLQFTYFMFQ